VNLRSTGIILVAATNHVNKLDGAAIREGRFDFKITVNNPDAVTRKLILAGALQKALGKIAVQDGAIDIATRRWNGFSVVRILSVVKELESMHRQKPFKIIKAEDIFAALRTLQGNSGLSVENAKGINNMVLPQDLKQDLQSVIYRMRNIQQIEEAGGSLPTGIVFYGTEPGTGKTECARSLAKDSGWAFLATTSNDLIADAGLIDKLYAQALSIRPCIIFIDEANDVLANRGFSQYSAMTNKLLTIMDGVSSEKRDIMFVAATNYIEQIDPAVLRGGRISEKYHFEVPDYNDQAEFIKSFMDKSKSTFGDDVSAPAIVKVMIDKEIKGTVANMSTLMQDAINTMIYRGVPNDEVTLKDFYQAAERQIV
jgi:transitional endoplasmic reticulum ATPase